ESLCVQITFRQSASIIATSSTVASAIAETNGHVAQRDRIAHATQNAATLAFDRITAGIGYAFRRKSRVVNAEIAHAVIPIATDSRRNIQKIPPPRLDTAIEPVRAATSAPVADATAVTGRSTPRKTQLPSTALMIAMQYANASILAPTTVSIKENMETT